MVLKKQILIQNETQKLSKIQRFKYRMSPMWFSNSKTNKTINNLNKLAPLKISWQMNIK